MPVGTSEANAIPELPSPDELRAELTRALADVDDGALRKALDALQKRRSDR